MGTTSALVKLIEKRGRARDGVGELRRAARALRRRYDTVQHIWTRETAMNIAEWLEERAKKLAPYGPGKSQSRARSGR